MSAKGADYIKQKRAAGKHTSIKREKNKKLVDYSILSRLKPRRVNIDKERLYEENMALKLKNNALHEELIRLRTKVSQVEKELSKKEDLNEHLQVLKPVHLVNSLKSAIKDLKNEIQQKNDEISKIRKNIKSTKINEIELEVQAYIDECTRLRHHLEEIMRQRDSPQMTQGLNDDKSMQQAFVVNNLQKENKDLNQAVIQGNDEVNKWKEKVAELEKTKKKNSVKKGELQNLKNEIVKLKNQIETLNKDLAGKDSAHKEEVLKIKKNLADASNKNLSYENKVKELTNLNDELTKNTKILQESKNTEKSKNKKNNPPRLFQVLYAIINTKRTSIQALVEEIGKKKEFLLDQQEFFDSLVSLNTAMKRKYIREIFGFIKTENKKIDLKKIEQLYNDFDYNERNKIISSSEDEPVLSIYSENKLIKVDTPVHERQSTESKIETTNIKQSNTKEEKPEEVKKDKIVEEKAKKDKTNEEKAKKDKINEEKAKQDKINEEKAKKDKIIEEKAKQDKINEEKAKQDKIKEDKRLEDEKFQKEKIKEQEKKKQEEAPKSKKSQDIAENQKLEAKINQEGEKPEEKLKNSEFEEDKQKTNDKKPNKESNFYSESNSNKEKKNSKGSENAKETKSKASNRILEDSKSPPKKGSFQDPELKQILGHFSFRMQINRIPKSKLFATLFGSMSVEKPLSRNELSSYLKKPPFGFNPSEIETLNNFLLDSPKSTVKSIGEKLNKYTDDWEVFSPEDEESFDEQLGLIISKYKAGLRDSCKEYDKENTGVVSLEDFKKVLSALKVQIPQKIFTYMMLLFYSHDMKISQVPYRHFIKAYGEPSDEGDEDDISDEEKAKVVRHYLGIIAQILIQNKRGPLDVFECDENGIISAEEFVVGLKRMGLEEIEQEHVMMMLEALQFEDAEEMCVHIEELEEILMHYGVQPAEDSKEDRKISEHSSEHSAKHYKKVSLLDSENYELSDDSPEKLHQKELSKGISENSPFTKNKSLDGKPIYDDPEEYDSDYDDEDFQ